MNEHGNSRNYPQPSDRVDTERVNFADLSQNEDRDNIQDLEKSEHGFALPTPSTKEKQKNPLNEKKEGKPLELANIERPTPGSQRSVKDKIEKIVRRDSQQNSKKVGFNMCICILALFFKGITLFV